MTEQALRKALKAKRMDEGWGFDKLYADVARVVGIDKAPTAATLRRFEDNTRGTRDTFVHIITKYVETLDVKAA